MPNNKYKILVIEDEANICEIIVALLDANGFQAIGAKDGATGKMLFASFVPDLIILDLGLPDMDGTKFLRDLRANDYTPIIVLSARSSENDKVEALDLGANDYISKPFGSAELIARIRSALRTTRHSAERAKLPGVKYEANGLVIDYDARQVTINDTVIKLTQTEYNIIALLSEQAGRVLTYSYIIKAIWGYNDYGSTKKLQVNMANIRKKFGAKPGQLRYIVNELGVGYRMIEPSE